MDFGHRSKIMPRHPVHVELPPSSSNEGQAWGTCLREWCESMWHSVASEMLSDMPETLSRFALARDACFGECTCMGSCLKYGHNLIMPPFLLQIFLFQIFQLWMKIRLEREIQIFFCVGGYLYSEGVLVREGLYACESPGPCALTRGEISQWPAASEVIIIKVWDSF